MAKTTRSRPALTSYSSVRRIDAILKFLAQGPATRLKISQALGISIVSMKNYIPHMRESSLIHIAGYVNELRREKCASTPVYAAGQGIDAVKIPVNISKRNKRYREANKAKIAAMEDASEDDIWPKRRKSKYIPCRGELETYLFGPAPAKKLETVK